VFYGNTATFLTLASYHGPEVVSMVDERGWTLLHIAASAGHADIARHLLKVGANPGSLTAPFWSHMPEELFGRQCTPRDIAAAESLEREQIFLEVSEGHEPASRWYLAVDDAEEAFLNAIEYQS
jgi:hypothetical protein